MQARLASAGFVLVCASCLGTTGGGLVKFDAFASGPPDAKSPLVFDTRTGFQVTLTSATTHIGAVYLTSSPANASSQNTSCIEPGQYIAEVPGGVDVNLLSPTPQLFSVRGDGSLDIARTGEVWLTGGDINAVDDTTQVVALEGIATRRGSSWSFTATVTIGSDRAKAVSDPAQPGLNPICKRRIIVVSPIETPVAPGASLYVRIDPRGWFNSVDFSQLDLIQATPVPLYRIPNSDNSATTGAAAGRNLLTGILTGVLPSGVSAITFEFR